MLFKFLINLKKKKMFMLHCLLNDLRKIINSTGLFPKVKEESFVRKRHESL